MTDKDLSHLSEEDRTYVHTLREEAKENRIKASNLTTALAARDEAVVQATAKITDIESKLQAANDVVGKYNTLRDEHAQALTHGESAELDLIKLRTALDVGLPHTFADRLKGGTPEELKADALSLKDVVGTGGKGGPGRVLFDRTDTSASTVSQTETGFPSIAAHLAATLGEE